MTSKQDPFSYEQNRKMHENEKVILTTNVLNDFSQAILKLMDCKMFQRIK